METPTTPRSTLNPPVFYTSAALILALVLFTVLLQEEAQSLFNGTVAKLAMRQPFVLFKGLTFQKLCLPGAFRPGDHHNK
ncbi:hypothetical protein ACRCPI_31445, partial [Pseudomonas aeruginosa]